MTTFDQLEVQKAEVLKSIEGWSTARLHHRPVPGAWSAAGVIDHIVKVETGILAAVKAGLPNPRPLPVSDRIKFAMLERLFRSKMKVKAPASVPAIMPSENVDLAKVTANWDDTRIDLRGLLSEVTPDQMKPGIFQHPVCGWMNLSQVLTFFSVHILHHGYQLDRLKAGSQGL